MLTLEKNNLRNIAKSHLTGMSPGKEHNRNVDTLATILGNHINESKGTQKIQLQNGVKALGQKFTSGENGKFSGRSFNEGFASIQEGDSELVEGGETAVLQEGEEMTTFNAIRPASVRYHATVGRVYASLFSPLFYRADPSSDSGRHVFDIYEAVIAKDRGNLKQGDNVYQALQGSIASGRVQEEVIAVGEVVATVPKKDFSAVLQSGSLKSYDLQEDDYAVVQYTWNDGTEDRVGVLIENQAGALLDELGATRGSVNHNTGTVTLNLENAPVEDTDIVCSYSQQMLDTGNGIALTLTKIEKIITIKKYSVLINVTYDGKLEFDNNPAISNYLNRIRENIVKASVDISGMDKLYRAGRPHTVVFDKTVPSGISEDEHMRGLKYAIQRAIAYLAEGSDADVEYIVRSIGGTKVTMLLESIASTHGETYRTVQPTLNANGVKLAGYLSNSDVEHFCGKFLDLKKRISSPVLPVQSENEILFGAVPKGEFAEIKPVAVMAIRNLLKNEDPTRDNTSEIYSYRSTAHVGFEVINELMFSVLAIENL